ncbi:hypothetical protein MMPV_006428 [Pyropia vietnamensis]
MAPAFAAALPLADWRPSRAPLAARHPSLARLPWVCAAAPSSDGGKRVLIINAPSGGHSVIGPHLAEALLAAGHQVHVHQVGTPAADTQPFDRYPPLAAAHPAAFSLSHGAAAEALTAAGQCSSGGAATALPPLDAVYDNASKAVADAAPALAAAAAGAEIFFVSSAGAYAYDGTRAPHVAGDPAAGPTIDVEAALRDAGATGAVFRPIYILGPGFQNRQYSDWLFDRIRDGRQIPIPGVPDALTCLTDVRDVAGLLASALGKGLAGEIVNATSPRGVTLRGVVALAAAAAGADPVAVADRVVWYDPAVAAAAMEGYVAKKAFPFRPRHFFADPVPASPAVADTLGWQAVHSGDATGLAAMFADAYDSYVALGLDQRVVDYAMDDAILAVVGGGRS